MLVEGFLLATVLLLLHKGYTTVRKGIRSLRTYKPTKDFSYQTRSAEAKPRRALHE